MICPIKSIAIIGYGKFGQLAHGLLKQALPETRLAVYSEPEITSVAEKLEVVTFQELDEFEMLVLAMPISALANVAKRLATELRQAKIIIDICSVKIYPKEILLQELPTNWQIICSHPLFGPASFSANHNSLKDLCVTVENVRCDAINYQRTQDFLKAQQLNVIEMSADEHDRFFGQPQFLTHLAAALFKNTLLVSDELTTLEGLRSADLFRRSLKMLTADQALLKDLYQFNPYAKEALKQVEDSWQVVMSNLK